MDARHPRPPRNARAKQPSSARQHAGPRQKNDAASAAHPTTAPTRRIVRRATDRPHCTPHSRSCCSLFLAPRTRARAQRRSAAAVRAAASRQFAAQDYAAALDAFEGAVAAGHVRTGRPLQHRRLRLSARALVAGRSRLFARSHARRRWRRSRTTTSDSSRSAPASRTKPARWFAQAERETSDERLKSLATAQLAQLPPPPERNWLAYGSLAAGYDDNVALISGGDVLGVSGTDDTLRELQLAAAAPARRSWRFDGGLVLLDYQDLDSFDQLGVNAGARYRWPLGEWIGEAGLQLSYSTLDGEGFESRRMLLLQATRRIDRRLARCAHATASATSTGSAASTAWTDTRHELGVRGLWRSGSWDVDSGISIRQQRLRRVTLSFDRHQLVGRREERARRELDAAGGASHGDRSSYDVDGERQRGTHRDRARRQSQSRQPVASVSCVTRTRTTRRTCPSSTTGATGSPPASKRPGKRAGPKLTPAGRRCFHASQGVAHATGTTTLFFRRSWQSYCWQAPAATPTRRRERRTASPTCRASGRTTPRHRWNGRQCFRAAHFSRSRKSRR